MPTARRYGNRQIETRALPGVRKTAADTDLSRGAGLYEEQSRTAERFGQLAGQVSQITGGMAAEMRAKAKRDADQVAVTEATNEHMGRMNDFFYNPETGAYTKKGKDAQEVPTMLADTFSQVTSDVAGKLKTPEQRAMFNEWVGKQEVAHDLSVKRHVFAEIGAYDQEVTTKALENYTNAAVLNAGDPVKVNLNLVEAEKVIRDFADRNGKGREYTDGAVAALRSQVHSGVIKQLLAEKKPGEAKEYMAKLGDQITDPDQKRELTKALAEGQVREQAQEEMDKIRVMPLDAEAKLAYVRKTYKGELEDQLINEIEHDERRAKVAKGEQAEARVNKARLALEQNPNIRQAIAPADWTAMSFDEARALTNYADALSQQKTIHTDPNLYAAWVTMATSPDPNLRLAFTQLNIPAHVDKLSREDYKQFIDLQGRVRTGDAAAAEKLLINPAAQTQMVNQGLIAMGYDPTPAMPGTKAYDADVQYRVGEYRRAVRDAVTRLEQRENRPARDEEVQSIVDQLAAPTGKRNTNAGGWGFDRWVPQFAYETAQARVASASDVPPAERSKIADALKRRGIQPNDGLILQVFNEKLAETRNDR